MRAQLPCAFFEQAKSAVTSVRKALDPDVTGPRRMLVLINPYGGGGKARGVWRRLSALLSHADIARLERITKDTTYSTAYEAPALWLPRGETYYVSSSAT